ncbi:hypothetical protein CIHG_00185 [Coccidioides immitis H538.4]|uniref:Uncharacterized protein n=2 Tax=Coccidioides immitis TaxID=5501 RepID=A0A0J8RBY2_COCIT|nr:hypothetical protein CIRG_07004 [Coccidioides immitis RMSCC 2394]KMU82402.1 hypothetical protein CIHG_00185 [Coccidioides immitis H538.4]
MSIKDIKAMGKSTFKSSYRSRLQRETVLMPSGYVVSSDALSLRSKIAFRVNYFPARRENAKYLSLLRVFCILKSRLINRSPLQGLVTSDDRCEMFIVDLFGEH